MQPLEFCDLAERLILNEKNAAGFRTAISRSYYGAFLQARDFLGRMSIHLLGPNHGGAVAVHRSSALVNRLRRRWTGVSGSVRTEPFA